MAERFSSLIRAKVPPTLSGAVEAAAARRMTTVSEYARMALIAQLRADGLDPTAPPAGLAAVFAIRDEAICHAGGA